METSGELVRLVADVPAEIVLALEAEARKTFTSRAAVVRQVLWAWAQKQQEDSDAA